MKFVHLSDLHLGIRVNGFSLIEDQADVLHSILEIIKKEAPDGVLIAGDVYDKSIPPIEAIRLYDDFLVTLAAEAIPVFVISGNHDSPERIAFGHRLMDAKGIHTAPVFDGKIDPVTLKDEYGKVNIYMLPFIKPAQVRNFYEDDAIDSYTDALRAVISRMNIDQSQRNILVTHQFVTGAIRSDSENVSVGGTDNVDAVVFEEFDYVALGHLHRSQSCGSEKIRYCGTPLKYSFSEANDHKSITIVELKEKGDLSVRTKNIVPLHDMIELKGRYDALTLRSFYENTSWQSDYLHITLTDESDIYDAVGKLRVIYPRLMKLDYDNARTRCAAVIDISDASAEESPLTLFSNFYQLQNNQAMNDFQQEYIEKMIESIWEESSCSRFD